VVMVKKHQNWNLKSFILDKDKHTIMIDKSQPINLEDKAFPC